MLGTKNGVRSLEEAVRAAAEAVTFDDLGREAIPRLARALDAAGVVFYRRVEADQDVVPLAGDLRELVGPYVTQFYASDPHHEAKAIYNPRIMLPDRYVDPARFQASDVYNEFYRRNEIEHFLNVRLTDAGWAERGMAAIVFVRSARQPEFSAREARAVAQALPALEAAVRRSLRVEQTVGAQPVLEALLERADPRPHVALDLDGRTLWASPRAERLLAPYLGPKRELPADVIAAARALGEVVKRQPSGAGEAVAAVAAAAGRTVPIAGAGGVRLRAELRIARTTTGAPFVEVEIDDLGGAGPAPSGAAARYGLTPAEADVLAVLALGLKNAEIAKRLFVSVETVRTHLRRIFAKMGVENRAQAILVARGLERAAAPPVYRTTRTATGLANAASSGL